MLRFSIDGQLRPHESSSRTLKGYTHSDITGQSAILSLSFRQHKNKTGDYVRGPNLLSNTLLDDDIDNLTD